MARITLKLPIDERDALFRLAEREYRSPREQAALIIRRELERLNLLTADPSQQPVAAVSGNGGGNGK